MQTNCIKFCNSLNKTVKQADLYTKKQGIAMQMTSKIPNMIMQKLTKDEAKELRQAVYDNAHAFTFAKTEQNENYVDKVVDEIVNNFQDFQSFLESIGYDGKKSIATLSKEDGARVLQEIFANDDYKKLDIKG